MPTQTAVREVSEALRTPLQPVCCGCTVVELRLKIEGLSFQPGGYCFLACDEISVSRAPLLPLFPDPRFALQRWQYHPFSFSSAQAEPSGRCAALLSMF